MSGRGGIGRGHPRPGPPTPPMPQLATSMQPPGPPTSSRSFDTTRASSASQSLPAHVSKLSLESSRNPNDLVTDLYIPRNPDVSLK